MLFFSNVEYIWTIPRPQTCISMQDSGLQIISSVNCFPHNLLLVLTRILTGDIEVRSVIFIYLFIFTMVSKNVLLVKKFIYKNCLQKFKRTQEVA